MARRSAAEAVEVYRSTLQQSLSCITRDVLTLQGASGISPYQPHNAPHIAELGGTKVTTLAGSERLRLRMLHRYLIVTDGDHSSGWSVETRSYSYAIDDSSGSEIIAYHWHPTGSGAVTHPHLHLGRAIAGTSLRFGERYLHRMHLPTSRVPLAAVIWLMIRDFGVRPLRNDWSDVLRDHWSVTVA